MGFNFALLYQSLESILTFCLIGCLGYYLAARGWFSQDSKLMLTRLITQVALPVYLLWNINTVMTRDQLASLAYGLPLPVVSVLLTLGLCLLFARVLRIPPTRRGAFCSLISFSNTVYIGIPFNLALFGEAAMPYALLYYFAHTILFWTLGNYLLASDNPEMRTRIFSLGTFRKIVSPPMYGFFAGMILLWLNLRLPTVLENSARYLGQITTPLVIICIGITLHDLGLKNIRITRELAFIVISRFTLSPAIVICLTLLFPLPELMTKVFIIQSSLPAMSTIPMLSALYKTDAEYTTVAVSLTTVLTVVTIPLYMVLLGFIFG